MNNSLKPVIEKLKIAGNFILRYRIVLTVLVAAGLMFYVVNSINRFSAIDKDEQRVSEGLASIKKVKFDTAAIDKIKALKDQDTVVVPELPQNRTNPF
jgi:hypothetical protein